MAPAANKIAVLSRCCLTMRHRRQMILHIVGTSRRRRMASPIVACSLNTGISTLMPHRLPGGHLSGFLATGEQALANWVPERSFESRMSAE